MRLDDETMTFQVEVIVLPNSHSLWNGYNTNGTDCQLSQSLIRSNR